MDRIDLLELQRKWGYVLIEPFISLPSQKARYTYTLQYAICVSCIRKRENFSDVDYIIRAGAVLSAESDYNRQPQFIIIT